MKNGFFNILREILVVRIIQKKLSYHDNQASVRL